jgi:hypothetical protein
MFAVPRAPPQQQENSHLIGDLEPLKGREVVNCPARISRRLTMNGLIYLIGLIVVIMFILSFLGLR